MLCWIFLLFFVHVDGLHVKTISNQTSATGIKWLYIPPNEFCFVIPRDCSLFTAVGGTEEKCWISKYFSHPTIKSQLFSWPNIQYSSETYLHPPLIDYFAKGLLFSCRFIDSSVKQIKAIMKEDESIWNIISQLKKRIWIRLNLEVRKENYCKLETKRTTQWSCKEKKILKIRPAVVHKNRTMIVIRCLNSHQVSVKTRFQNANYITVNWVLNVN